LVDQDIERILLTFNEFKESEQSKVFDNAAFGYWKVIVERPLRIAGIDPERAYTPKEIKTLKAEHGVDASAPPVIRKIYKSGTPDPLRGTFESTIKGKRVVVEYEPDTDLRDNEQIPLIEAGGIEEFITREVLPHASDAWFDADATKIGYEISFNQYFYKPQPLRSMDQIKKDILALERETEGLLKEVVGDSV
jgi:type I restriction enzyme M protein